MGLLSIMRVHFEVLAVKTPTSPSPWIQGSWSRTTRPRRQRRRSPLPLPLPSAAQARPPARNPSPAPFSYLTLYCPTFNESSDPKRRTYQIIYLVQGTLRFPVIYNGAQGNPGGDESFAKGRYCIYTERSGSADMDFPEVVSPPFTTQKSSFRVGH